MLQWTVQDKKISEGHLDMEYTVNESALSNCTKSKLYLEFFKYLNKDTLF